MARLTERELTLIQRAREISWRRATEAAPQIMQAARAAQSAAFSAATSRGMKLLARYTGLSDIAHFVKAGIVNPLRRSTCYRRTIHELRHLDAHRLHDIGMTRGDLERFAWQAAVEQIPATSSRPWLFTRLKAGLRRQALVRQLATLNDRSLLDIGVERGDIGQIVDLMMEKEYPELQAEKPAATPAPVNMHSRSIEILRELAAEPNPLDLFKLEQARRAA